MMHSRFFTRLRESTPFAWWTTFVWLLFVTSIAGHFSRLGEDPVMIAWWLAGVIGITAGILGIYKRGTWLALAMLAGAILVVFSALYWQELIEALLSQEQQRSIETVLSRVWQIIHLGLRTGIRSGTSHWVIATYYREIFMPLLQLLTLILLGVLYAIDGRGGKSDSKGAVTQ